MIISITAPRHGYGKTITSINLSYMLASYLKKKILLIDLNTYSKDIAMVLTGNMLNKGIDDFMRLNTLDMLGDENMMLYTYEVEKNVYIMNSQAGISEVITKKEIKTLINYASKNYEYIVIDTVSNDDEVSSRFMDESDKVFCLFDQNIHVVKLMKQYWEDNELTIDMDIIINKYNSEAKFDKRAVQKIFDDKKVYYLPYDIGIVNEFNDHSILNFIGSHVKNNRYYMEMKNIVQDISGKTFDKGGLFSMFKTDKQDKSIGEANVHG
jgi:MinD-like ATPase involved in chromosome partitioning or flagellar assembly